MIRMLARRNFFNDFMSDPFDFGFFGTEPAPKANASLMKTDVKETDKAYELDIDLPGFDKENVQIELNDGYPPSTLLPMKRRKTRTKTAPSFARNASLVHAAAASTLATMFRKTIFPLSSKTAS